MNWLLLTLLGCPGPNVEPLDSGNNTGVTSVQGEITIVQLGLSSSGIGEAALIRGPDGTTVLLDVGGPGHARQVVDAVETLVGPTLNAVILTHAHTDHIGAFEAIVDGGLTITGPVVHRGAVDLEDANTRQLQSVLDHPGSLSLCDDTGCPGLPWTLTMGDASLTLFAANGHVATQDGRVELDVPLTEENARSLVGVVTFGDFQYVFGGDVTGGGKDTPDVESAIAALGHVIPWVDAGQVDLVHLNHHGISSSTSPAWVGWLLGEGRTTHGLVGATGVYLDAPSEEALDAIRPYLGDGRVWVTRTGLLGGADPVMVEANGSIHIVVDGNANGTITLPDGSETTFDASR
jgi:hypothetical protein